MIRAGLLGRMEGMSHLTAVGSRTRIRLFFDFENDKLIRAGGVYAMGILPLREAQDPCVFLENSRPDVPEKVEPMNTIRE
jgi:hypothetical protein